MCCGVLTKAYRKENRDRVLGWKSAARQRERIKNPLQPRRHDAHVRAHTKWHAWLAGRLHSAHVTAYRKSSRYRTALKKAWLEAHPGEKRAKKARRRAAKLQATPAWADPVAIGQAYFAATLAQRDTNSPWHVDHIVPLNSPIVCGLHCEANLQILPGVMNIEKSNRYWPDMPT